ncbi:MAG TPA: hypothetical protein VMT32_22180 [Bryobacteraceae bacterium]|nr:hypothetical protein [Bryobacteraceae bacterium]
MRAVVLFAIAGALCAQFPPDPTDVLARARDSLTDRDKRLPNYTCVQTVNRKYFQRPKQAHPVPACSVVTNEERAAYPLQLYLADRLRLDVKVSRGHEIGSWAGASQFDSKSIFDLVGGGPFGTGALGTFLADIFTGGGARFEFDGEKSLDDVTLYQYSYQVPLSASHYLVRAGHDWQLVAYDGLIRIDPHSFDLRHLLVHTSELPFEADTCEVATNVDYERVRIGTGDFLLPLHSQLHIVKTDNYETDTTTTYSGCHEYHGEATIRFGDEPAVPGASEKIETARPVALPAGLAVSLALVTPIDTDTAAAGDVVLEKVRKPVRAQGSDKVLIPAGATVHARIIRMQHWFDSPGRFDIAIQLETWEANGVALPLSAKPDCGENRPATSVFRRPMPIMLPPAGQPITVATFVFTASHDRYVVPRGFESNWITVAPKP